MPRWSWALPSGVANQPPWRAAGIAGLGISVMANGAVVEGSQDRLAGGWSGELDVVNSSEHGCVDLGRSADGTAVLCGALAERRPAALLADRPEALAVLTVDTKRPRLQAMYEGWGYRKVGERQPFPDSPLYAVMLLDRMHTA